MRRTTSLPAIMVSGACVAIWAASALGALHQRLGRIEQLVDEPDGQRLLGAHQPRCQQQIDGAADPG